MELANYDNRRMKMMAEQVAGNIVLDIGYAHMPNQYLTRFDTTGIDLESPPKEKQIYRRHIADDIRNIAKHFDQDTVRFDTIVAGEFIEHLENPYEFLRSIRPLLGANGRLVLSTPNPMGFPVFLCELFQLKKYFYTIYHTYYFLPRWMHRVLELSGYEVEKTISVGLWGPFFTLPAPVALSYQVIYVARPKQELVAK
jgi:2-polyprenyl-3-methyl-5-hydroxy-6-metoxy-1,4-benzoquinol methylase